MALRLGELPDAVAGFLDLPGQVRGEADLHYELGLALLEAGEPSKAGEHLAKAIALGPDMPSRPVAAYYLEKLGRPVPPPRVATPGPGQAPQQLPEDVFAKPTP